MGKQLQRIYFVKELNNNNKTYGILLPIFDILLHRSNVGIFKQYQNTYLLVITSYKIKKNDAAKIICQDYQYIRILISMTNAINY